MFPEESSSSDSEPEMTSNPRKTSELAYCEIKSKGLPILHAGVLTIRVLQEFEYCCKNSFGSSKVEQADQVPRVLYNIRCPLIQEWIENERSVLVTLSFDQFIIALRDSQLSSTWAQDATQAFLNCSMGKDQCFRQWVHTIRLLNLDLKGQPAHHDDIRLRPFICNKMDPDLRNRLGKPIHDIVQFKDWVDAIQLIDEQLKSDRKRTREEFEFLWNQKRPRISEMVTKPASRFPHSVSSSRPAPSSSQPQLSSTLPRLPKLTIEERDFLKLHNGCYKCRRTEAGHISKDCPNPFPNPATYVSPLHVAR